MYTIVTAVLLLSQAVTLSAQSRTVVKAVINRNRILIGEPIRLTITVDIPSAEPIRFFTIDSIPHFEFLEQPAIDTSNTQEGTRLVLDVPITSFDSGHWVIPAFALADNITTDTLPVDVGFSPFDPNQPYHDIKDIIDVDPKKEQPWWWYAAAGALLLLILLIILLRKKKKPVVAKPVPTVNAYEEAMQQLEDLQRGGVPAKQFHSQLAEIFRLYVFRRKGILSLQKTTDDLVIQLKDLGFEKNSFDRLSQALRLGDFVKFAKYIPTGEDNSAALDAIKTSINEIEKMTDAV